MDIYSAIHKYYSKDIKTVTPLTGGFSFETYLVTFCDGQKVVIRSAHDFVTSGGRKIVISDIFHREKFFYDTVNTQIGHICPVVYFIDDTLETYDKPYQISEFLEGMPLNIYYSSADKKEQDNTSYKIGEICAKINSLKIDTSHPYFTQRGDWQTFIVNRITERVAPFIGQLISLNEVNTIIENLKLQRVENTSSFLHLDMRHINMIYNNSHIFVLDAENCEFGDPLFDIATVDVGGGLNEAFLNGYKNIIGTHLNLNQYLYYCYKFERLSLVVNVFMNEVKSDVKSTAFYLEQFHQVKDELLSMTI